jgi:hypothetical protein
MVSRSPAEAGNNLAARHPSAEAAVWSNLSRDAKQPTSRLCSADESVMSLTVASGATFDPSMGFVPLQGLSGFAPGPGDAVPDKCWTAEAV